MTPNQADRDAAAPIFTPENIAAAEAEIERLAHELDITNADHIVIWLEANVLDSSLDYLACRIVEAHEKAMAAHRRAALEEAAKLAEEYNRWSYVQFSDGEWQPGSPYDRGQQNAAQAITTDIRALIDKEPT